MVLIEGEQFSFRFHGVIVSRPLHLPVVRDMLQLNGSLFFDKRDASQFDYLTVNETAFDPPVPGEDPENNMNSPHKLSLEATMINQNFSQQILKAGQRKV